jgi:threonine/homoserine/homoserine lactone efflux protein
LRSVENPGANWSRLPGVRGFHVTVASNLLGIFGTAFIVGLSGAMMPGPLLAVTISESTRRGAMTGPLIVLGHMVLEATLVAGLALGIAAFLKAQAVVAGISVVGGAMLCWMGQGMIRSAARLSVTPSSEVRKGMHPAVAGAVVSLLNPYWSLWWATIGIGYVAIGSRSGWPGVAVFFAGHILSDFVWYTLVSVTIARGKRLLTDPAYRWTIRLCGAGIVFFGLWFLRDGIRNFAGL